MGHLDKVLVAATGSSSTLIVKVSGASHEDLRGDVAVELTVVSLAGRRLLERHYELAPEDCGEAPALFAVVVGRLLETLPRDDWAPTSDTTARSPAPPPRSVAAEHAAAPWVGALELRVATHGDGFPVGVDGELGARFDIGRGSTRLGAIGALRVAAPQKLGSGWFQETALLGGLGWRYVGRRWTGGIDLRAGGVRVMGFEYDRNHVEWLPWLEGVVMGQRRWGQWALGLELQLSPLRHRMTTEDRGNSQYLPSVRVGVVLALPLYEEKL